MRNRGEVVRTVLVGVAIVCVAVLASVGGRECSSISTRWESTDKLPSDKRAKHGAAALMRAAAEYRCLKVVLEGYEPHSEIAQVNVCDTRRWYNCAGYSCREIFYKAWDRELHLSVPDDVYIATGCKQNLLGKVCFVGFGCWKCKTAKIPKRPK